MSCAVQTRSRQPSQNSLYLPFMTNSIFWTIGASTMKIYWVFAQGIKSPFTFPYFRSRCSFLHSSLSKHRMSLWNRWSHPRSTSMKNAFFRILTEFGNAHWERTVNGLKSPFYRYISRKSFMYRKNSSRLSRTPSLFSTMFQSALTRQPSSRYSNSLGLSQHLLPFSLFPSFLIMPECLIRV